MYFVVSLLLFEFIPEVSRVCDVSKTVRYSIHTSGHIQVEKRSPVEVTKKRKFVV